MKKLSFLTVAICILGLMAFPQAATAGLVALNTTELAGVTGQAGITFLGGQVGLDLENEIFSFEEVEGMEELAETGLFGLVDAFLDSATISAEGIHIEPVVNADGDTGVVMTMQNPEAHVNNFHHDIRLGSAPDMSNSLGIVGIRGMHVRTTGSVRVRVN
ncbi:MAG: hypothetical protein SWH61_16690 [Thermodesulfobacteriota bacterium]|nr:hypothetical protein [Thermodesulfobacteriota bacterium]